MLTNSNKSKPFPDGYWCYQNHVWLLVMFYSAFGGSPPPFKFLRHELATILINHLHCHITVNYIFLK